jgi:hypothetical protein
MSLLDHAISAAVSAPVEPLPLALIQEVRQLVGRNYYNIEMDIYASRWRCNNAGRYD